MTKKGLLIVNYPQDVAMPKFEQTFSNIASRYGKEWNIVYAPSLESHMTAEFCEEQSPCNDTIVAGPPVTLGPIKFLAPVPEPEKPKRKYKKRRKVSLPKAPKVKPE